MDVPVHERPCDVTFLELVTIIVDDYDRAIHFFVEVLRFELVEDSPAFKLYVCNVAEEPAQTEGYHVLDHLDIVRYYGGEKVVDAVVANNNLPNYLTPAALEFIRTKNPWEDNVLLIEADLIDETDRNSTARHDSVKLSNTIAEAYRKHRGHRRRLPRVRLNLDLNGPAEERPVLNRNRESKPPYVGQKEGQG